MKIHSLTTGSVGYSNRVREQQNDQQSSSENGEQGHEQAQQQEAQPNSEQIKQEDLEQAVEAFHTDKQMQANGLNASVTGSGPGLRVVFKDESGAVVRQLTGEEFMRLRDSSFTNGRVRGKILDQKL